MRRSLIHSKPKTAEQAAALVEGWIVDEQLSARACRARAADRWGYSNEETRAAYRLAVEQLVGDLNNYSRGELAAISTAQLQALQARAAADGDTKAAAAICQAVADRLFVMPRDQINR